jgi:4-amino-4-deoxy-L-arabinose transferase-like glycosyltransferase
LERLAKKVVENAENAEITEMAEKQLRRPAIFAISAFLIAVVGFAIYAHLKILPDRLNYLGSLALADRLFDLLLASGLALLSFGVGRYVCERLAVEFSGVAEELAFSVLMGAGVIGAGVMALGLVGLLKAATVAPLLFIFLLLSIRQRGKLKALLSRGMNELTDAKWLIAVALLFALWIASPLLRAATPPYSPDEGIYHLAIPKLFVEQNRIFPTYDNFSGNLPMLIHMHYAICLMARAEIAAKLFSLLLAVNTAVILYAFGKRFFGRVTGLFAFFSFFAAGIVVEVAVTTRIDVTLAGMLFGTTYALIVWLEKHSDGWLYIAGIFAGFSLSIKYSAAIWLLLLGIMFMVESLRRKLPVSSIVKKGFCFVIIALAVSSPWYIKNAIWFHNPVYPFFTGEAAEYEAGKIRYFNLEDEQRIARHFERAQKEIPEPLKEQERTLANAASRRLERHPFRFWEYFTKPDNYGMAEPRQTPNYLFLIAPLFLLLRRQRWLLWLLCLSVAFFFLTAASTWLARYFLPVYPPLTVLTAHTLNELAVRFGRFRYAGLASASLVLSIALAVVLGKNDQEIKEKGIISYLTGSQSRSNFLSSTLSSYLPAELINNYLPAGSKALLIGEQLSYEIRRPCVMDAGWDAVEWRRLLAHQQTLDEVHQSLKKRGVAFIVYQPSLFPFVAWVGRAGSGPSGETMKLGMGQTSLAEARGSLPDYYIQQQNWATFEMYQRNFLELIYGDATPLGYKIYRLK